MLGRQNADAEFDAILEDAEPSAPAGVRRALGAYFSRRRRPAWYLGLLLALLQQVTQSSSGNNAHAREF